MAKVKVLVEGYLSDDNDKKTCSTVSLVLDKDIVMVVDPGYLENQKILVDALKKEGFDINDVNIVCITHSHIDHYRNIGMFPNAKTLEYFGLWDKEGRVADWQEHFSSDIQVLKTPGHDYTCITLFVQTDDGVVAICGDVFWKEDGPDFDIYASDIKKLENSRKLVLKLSNWIIPGHAGIYKTKNTKLITKENVKSEVKLEVVERCKKCRKPFTKSADRCFCQRWLCYHCCECELDCNACNCKHKR